MYCNNCGKELRKTDRFCSNCGTDNPFYEEEITEPEFETPEETKPAKKPDKHEEILAILGLVLLFFIFPVGLIISIVGWCTFKDPVTKKTAMISSIIGFFLIVVYTLAIIFAIIEVREYIEAIEREINLFLYL